MTTGLERLTNDQVEAALIAAVRQEHRSTAQVLRCLIEFAGRRLHEIGPFPSLFHYCTSHLGYAPDSAYKRLRAAEIAAKYPVVVDLVEERRLKLWHLVIVAPHLTQENHREMLEAASTMNKRELRAFVAAVAPQALRRDSIRALPAPPSSKSEAREPPGNDASLFPVPSALGQPFSADPPGAIETAPCRAPEPAHAPPPAKISPVTATITRVSFNADVELMREIERACELLNCRRTNLAPLMRRAFGALLAKVDPDRRTTRRRPSARPTDPHSRRIPAWVRAQVWKRDGGQCSFRDSQGRRCPGRTDLQYDHIRPLSLGGVSNDPANVRLLCVGHHKAASRQTFGEEHITRAIEIARRKRRKDSRPGPPTP